MREIELRRHATAATEGKFRDKPFDWSKAATCIHLLSFHAKQMGHSLPPVPRFRTALTAKKALKKAGYESLVDVMDAHFERIPPAFMRVGDVLALPGDQGWHSIVIKGDKTKFLGWHQDVDGCCIQEVSIEGIKQSAGAWRL